MKVLNENGGKYLHNLKIKFFLNITPKAKPTKAGSEYLTHNLYVADKKK